MFFNKPKFKFYSTIPGVCETYPIIEAKKVKHNWVKPAVDAFKAKIANIDNYQNTLTGVAKCPGVFDIMHQGWILTAWCDIIIEVDLDKNFINWRVPEMLNGLTCGDDFNKPVVSFISTANPEMSIPMKKSDIPLLVKINTPWTVEIPKGWKLLLLPVSYSDDTRFKSTEGILRSEEYMEINPQLYWSVKHGSELIKAGTPLCQMIPVRDNSVTFECNDFTNDQRKKQKQTYFKRASTFIRKA